MADETSTKPACAFCLDVVMIGCADTVRGPDGRLYAARWCRVCDRCPAGNAVALFEGRRMTPMVYRGLIS